jgi:uncharacterized protein (TIGR03437 family)
MRRFGFSAEVLVFLLAAASPNDASGQTAKPTVAAVTNVASYGNGPISPGEMVVIFGTGMGPSNLVGLQLDQQGRVANILSQVQVLFDGNPAPLIYVSAEQISAMVPYGLAGKSTTQIQVVYQGSTSDSFQKPIAPSAPGIFTADSSGQGQAAMTNSDNSYNTSSNPATPGSYVTFYLTGEGQTNPLGSDGNIATSTANVALSVTVLIAGRTAQLLYAGSAPGNVNGFCQINAVIPPDLQYGGNLPLVVQIGGVSTRTGVTLAVSGPPAPVPGAPQNPTASVNSSAQIVLTWTPADSLATRFHIERQVAGSGFSEIAVIQSSATTFTDVNVTAGTVYQYRIRAENDYGFSAYSAVVSATVPVVQLLPPSNLQAVAVSQTQINLTWSAANTNATKFHIERKSGPNGAYAEIAVVPSTATSYQDTTVQPSTAYTYRARSEGASGFSAYSNESSATTPALPLPPAPTLQGTTTSSSQVHLSWTTTAIAVILFSVERRTTTGVYSQISQPVATSTSFDDSGLTGSTTYLYRMRVQTGAGFSPYSNEVTVTTLQALPAAPTNLQATAISSSQVNLTWTNNAPDATAVRVESQPAGSASFTDIGAAATLTSARVTNLQPNTAYNFRVRAQNAAGYSAYSNVVKATTLSVTKTVFLIHGIGQDHTAMQGLWGSLTAPLGVGLDPARFQVDYQFDFSECANTDFCNDATCSISAGAQKLANYINTAKPPGDIVLIGFSMGGLIARDLMANNWLGVLNGRKVAALITLGTPNIGYPYTFVDTLKYCTPLVQEMNGNWRSQQAQNSVVTSAYLSTLNNTRWAAISYPGTSGVWYAASGRSCHNPYRTVDPTTGCRDSNVYSDGVVCNDSATYNVVAPAASQPTRYYQDSSQMYVHSSGGLGGVGSALILCGNSGGPNNPPLSDPPPGLLLSEIMGVINALH